MDFLRNLDWKKIGLIGGFLVVSGGIGYLLYWVFFAPTPSSEVKKQEQTINQLPAGKTGEQQKVDTTQEGETTLPVNPVTRIKVKPEISPDEVASGGVTKVKDLDFGINKKIVSAADRIVTFNADTGKFYKLNNDGEKEELSTRIYKDVKNVTISPKTNQAILEFPDNKNVLYDYVNDKQISLPEDWTDFNFSNEGTQIAFKDMNANPDYRWLGIANPDGSGQKYIEQIGDKANDFKVDWSPNGSMIAQYKTGKSADASKIYFVGKNNENFRALELNGYGAETKWTPDGNRLLYSAHTTATDNKPELYIVDAAGDNIGYNHQSLKLNTWADKCAFANADTVYCAVPKELPANANLMPSIANNIPDYIYKVNLKTGVKSFVAEPEFNYTIDQLVVSGDEDVLYFTDNLVGNVHSIKLK